MIKYIILTLLIGCGSKAKDPSPQPKDPEFDQIAGIVQSECGPCHNGSNQRQWNQFNFKLSAAANRIKQGTMPPPPRTLSEENKTALLAYLEK